MSQVDANMPIPAVPLDYGAESPQPLAPLIRAIGVLVAVLGAMNATVRVYALYFSYVRQVNFGGLSATLSNVEIAFSALQIGAGILVAVRVRLIGVIFIWALCRIALSLIDLAIYTYSLVTVHRNPQVINIVTYQFLNSLRATIMEIIPPILVVFVYGVWRRSAGRG